MWIGDEVSVTSLSGSGVLPASVLTPAVIELNDLKYFSETKIATG